MVDLEVGNEQTLDFYGQVNHQKGGATAVQISKTGSVAKLSLSKRTTGYDFT